jgi:hypothetical protein
MESSVVTAGIGYKIWGVDGAVYGPVELPALVAWIKEERVTGVTWVYSEKNDTWHKAADVPELRMFFRPKTGRQGEAPTEIVPDRSIAGLKPGSLRRVKILAEMTDDQLERFVTFMEVEPAKQWTEIVKQGQHGDAMYFVLEGELRVRMMIAGKETILVTLSAGEFFGEISLFDHGARSADVVANTDSVLLKISAKKFQKLIGEAPDLAAPFLFAMGKTLTARIRADNKRYRDSVNFARTAGAK